MSKAQMLKVIESSLNDYKASNIEGLVGEVEGEGASEDDEEVEDDPDEEVDSGPDDEEAENDPEEVENDEDVEGDQVENMSQAQILKVIESRPEKSDTEADVVLIKEFERVYRKLDRLANTTLTDRKDRINFNLLREKERKLIQLLGYEKSQKLRSDFYNKRMLRGTKEWSEESDVEVQESPATAINSEILEKFEEVPGRIQTSQDTTGWTSPKRRTRRKAKK